MITRLRALLHSPRIYAMASFYLGLGATLAGNVGTADLANPWSIFIAALPAIALLFVFEMIMRQKLKPSRRRWYHHAMRLVPALAIMGFCACLSIGHLMQLAAAHGLHGKEAVMWALLPDAMMLLSTIVLADSPKPRTAAKPATATRKAPARKPATKRATAGKTAATPAAPVAARTRKGLSLILSPAGVS